MCVNYQEGRVENKDFSLQQILVKEPQAALPTLILSVIVSALPFSSLFFWCP